MEQSVLTSTKKILGISETYTAFDLDIITHINSSFSSLNQLGIGPIVGFMIEDSSALWSSLEVPMNQLNMIKTYIFLKTRLSFDPPTTSFMIKAMEDQILEQEWRLSLFRENALETEVESV